MSLAKVSWVIPHLCGLPRHLRLSRLLLVIRLRAFFDESDTSGHGPRQVFSMGGWVADVETWEKFSDDWDRELHQAPAIAYFKHQEAKSRTEQFAGWNERDTNRKIMSLAEVIDQHINRKKQGYGLLTGMKPEVLRVLLKRACARPKQVRSVTKITEPYDFCFQSILGMVLVQQCSIGCTTPADFVFDTHDSFHRCAAVYRELKKRMPDRMLSIAGSVTEGDDKQLAPLQAADLLVGQLTTNLKNGKPENPFQLLLRGERILFSPIRWGEDAALTGFASIIEAFNVGWATLMLEKAAKKKT